MKAGNSFLDADMATIGRWLREGWTWWTAELRALAPASWRGGARAFAATVHWQGPGRWERSGRGTTVVLVDPALCLERRLVVPPMSEADLQRFVALEAAQALPIDPARLVIAAAADPADRTRVVLAALPRERAQDLAADLAGAGIVPARIGLADPARPGRLRVDFTPALQDVIPVSGQGGAWRAWWAAAVFLIVLNLGLLVWRDVQSVERLDALVQAQQPAVNAARVITHRITSASRQAGEVVARRRRHDALGVLAGATRALPAQAWVQRYAWDGGAIRLSGFRRADADVVAALRRSGGFAQVRLASTEAMAEVPGGVPFDVTAQVREPGR